MRKCFNIVYSILFIILLLLPLMTMNLKTEQVSIIDNEKLPELELRLGGFRSNLENYVDKRIGFRTESLDLYQQLNAKLFGVLEHPLYMYGENGYVFFSLQSYISDYQHLNLDSKWATEFAQNMQKLANIAEKYEAEFIYMLVPDKKTVYSEYFPKSVNVKGDTSRTEQVLKSLSQTNINWIYMDDIMLEGKKTMQVCNVLYDAGHWNENGAFLCYQHLYERMRGVLPELEPLKLDDFEVKVKEEQSLQVSRFKIREEVPYYSLKQNSSVSDAQWLEENLFFPNKNLVHTRYKNTLIVDKPKILVFHDSYMFDHEKFFVGNFSEVTFIHRENLFNLEVYEEYLKRISPDIVLYENPQRVFPITFNKEYVIPE
ncbi:MAG: hypothetical protein IJE23_01565 [Tyzzerella sp.]|nr:hypothetical protein [Tyzzerella sp.]